MFYSRRYKRTIKKEVLEFHVQGDELPHSENLVEMAGSIVVMEVQGSEAGEINVEFKSIQRDSKKTALKFNVKGDSEDKLIKLYPLAGRGITLLLEPSQMSIDEFYEEPDEGLEYNVNPDGTVDVHENQMSIDEVAAAAAEENDDDLLN